MECGTEVKVVLPGTDGEVGARVVRHSGGGLALAFRQDGISLRLVDRGLDFIVRKLEEGETKAA